MDSRIEELETVKDLLELSDLGFAQSLLDQYHQFGKLTGRQWPYIEIMIKKAVAPPDPIEPVVYGDFGKIRDFLIAAREKGLKWPKVTIMTGTTTVQFTLNQDNSPTNPNAVNITDGKPYGSNRWWGRIAADGAWNKCGSTPPSEVEPLVYKFATDPAAQSIRFGKLSGHCCFCGLPLTDVESVARGAGPTCAKKYGL